MRTPALSMLVVSSGLRVRLELERVGRDLGLAIHFAEDLRTAVATIRTAWLDVVVLGPDLVDDDLRDTILRIHALDDGSTILAVLPVEDVKMICKAFRAGAKDVLSMPLSAHELSAAIASTFGPVPIEPGLAPGSRLN